MEEAGKVVCKGFLLLLAGTFIGTALLALAYMLPVNTKNRDISYAELEEEGWYPRAFLSARSLDTYFHSYYPDVLDGSTDKIMLYMAMDDSEGNPFVRAMRSYSEYSGEYSYYWHGYVTLLRPLFLLFQYSELRILNSILQLLLVLLLALFIYRKKGMRYVFMLITSYGLLSPFALAMGLQFTWVFYVAYTGALVLLAKRKFFAQKYRYLLVFMALGMMSSYFDLLTYPLITWGVPLIWWLVTAQEERKERFWVGQVVLTGIAWIAGYGLLWMMKWVLASLILGKNVFEWAMGEVFIRSGTTQQEFYSVLNRLQAVYTNWKHYEYKIYALALTLWLAWWVVLTFLRGFWRQDGRRRAYLLIGFSSIVWYFVLANHTQGHHFFTYRIFAVSILAFLAIILSSVDAEKNRGKVPVKRRILMTGVCLTAAVLAVFLITFAREEKLAINGYEAFRQIPLQEGDFFEVAFTPTFDEIKGMGLGLEGGGTKGEYTLSLWDGDDLKYQEVYSVEDPANNYQTLKVNWKLDKRKTYRMRLTVEEADQPVFLWVTQKDAMPLMEYGQLTVNDRVEKGQILTGITYWTMPTSRKTQMFLVMTGMGAALASLYALCPAKGKLKLISDKN